MIAQIKPLPSQISPVLRTIELNSSQNPEALYDALYNALIIKRDRLSQSALPGTVHARTVGNSTYYERRYYCPQKRKTVYAAIVKGQQNHIRECCAAWRELKDVERFITGLVQLRDLYNSIFLEEFNG